VAYCAPVLRLVLVAGLAVSAAALSACEKAGPASQVPEGATRTVLSLQKLDCENCGAEAAGALKREPGVYAVEFDKQTAEATVHHDGARVDAARLVAVVQGAGFDAEPGPGAGEYRGVVQFPAGLDVAEIGGGGKSLDIERELVPGKVTVFDFFAVWCGPCKKVDRHMAKLLPNAPDVALRKIDVVDWESDVAARYLGDVPNLPFVVVYGADGRRVAEISGLKLDALDAAIEKGRAR
jgi:thiol-disulfide isomerase/thioredoxin